MSAVFLFDQVLACTESATSEYIFDSHPAQDAKNRNLAVHELVDFQILLLAGSQSMFTEITGYTSVSLQQPRRELK